MAPADCAHERSHTIDSRFFGHRYSTPASRRIFCDICRFQRWLDIEVALASSQAQLGMIPEEAAEEIARAARLERIDLDEVRDGIRRTEHALVSLLDAAKAACAGDAGEFLHYGATTQDIIDTGLVLDMRSVLDEVGAELARLVDGLVELAARHRDTLMIGRTHARPALPTTFGLKVAGWIDELFRHAERLEAMRGRVLVVELFGGVGTLAGFDGRGRALVESFARRLSLHPPTVGWHVARDRVAEFATALAMLSATLGRVGDEVRMLSRPEYGELEEAWHRGKVGSSTMPHKRNPEGLEQVVVLARLTRASATLTVEAMIQEHERDSRGTRLEWTAVPEVSHYTLASLAILRPILAGLTVHEDHMENQTRRAAEHLCSEALMLALARRVGKQSAHGLVYELSQAAQTNGVSLRTSLASRPDITGRLGDGELEAILDPARHVGEAGAMVDRVLADARRWLRARPDAAL
ncbi:MAG: adenylosuccinate lyase family protein [Actinomycetota bacterium]|nr:adenylosuccinate lyase family protein [Actinomycetota bacterium]